MRTKLLAAALAIACGSAWAATPPAPASSAADTAAARRELEQMRGEMRTLAQRMADLSARLGEAAPRADAFFYVADPDRGMLGVVLSPDAKGARVGAVTPGGPAEQAGLAIGDVIVSVDGKPLHAEGERGALAQRSLGSFKAGQTVKLGIERDGKPMTVSVKAERRDTYAWPLLLDVQPALDAARAQIEHIDVARITEQARRAAEQASRSAAML
ncbi:MAG TPA: PDZ domain-containing protein, partial [Mizugakiibacter sp.]